MMKEMTYEPNKKSLSTHEIPDWFHDAKFGIFMHWSLSSVPAFAVTGLDLVEVIKTQGFKGQFKNNPYAEWYLNSLRIEGSPTHKHHLETYGEDFSYDDFVPMFNEAIKKWNPDEMAEIIKKAGAKYVCFVTKHHDGFLLWPSEYPNPHKENYMASRDIVGELSKAVKSKGMRMTFYYSGALDWSFNPNPIRDVPSFLLNGPTSPEYTEYANNHWYELIDKYGTDILWNDIGYPPDANIYELFAYYYNKNPDGVINDRWMQVGKRLRKIAKAPLIRNFVNWVAKKVMAGGGGASPAPFHCDYRTPEYRSFPEIQKHKWETCRGVGNSFGYNKEEKDEDYLTPEDLIRMFIDIVSKNGNLLLNVGPMADGTIPEIQQKCILGLGKWLEVNGEAIYGTRPWIRAESETIDGIGVRFTKKPDALYAIILDKPKTSEITIKSLRIDEPARIELFGVEGTLEWTQQDDNLAIKVPEKLEDFPAYALKISPKP